MQRISSEDIIDLLLDAVCVVQPDSTIEFVSPAFERIFGYTPEEVTGRRMLDMIHPDDLPSTEAQVQRVMQGQLQLQFENRYLRKDGAVVHIRWTARWLPERQVRLAVAHDITERKATEAVQAALYGISEAAHAAQTLQMLFQRIHQILGQLLPADNLTVALLDAASGALSFPYHVDQANAAVPDPAAWRQHPLCTEVIGLGRTVLLAPGSRGLWQGSGLGPAPLYWLGVPLSTSQGGVLGALVLQSYTEQARYTPRDQELLQFVSTQVAAAIERTQMLERLAHMAQYDPLTQLPNRQLFLDRLRTALARAQREQGRLSLLFIDLDRFKEVNDTHGHAAGDELLLRVAQRLLGAVRGSDTVARLGGDEFVVLLEGSDATPVAEKVLAAFERAFDLQGGHRLHVRPSIGIATYPEHGAQEHHLLSRADEAMYLSKKSGGNQMRVANAHNTVATP